MQWQFGTANVHKPQGQAAFGLAAHWVGWCDQSYFSRSLTVDASNVSGHFHPFWGGRVGFKVVGLVGGRATNWFYKKENDHCSPLAYLPRKISVWVGEWWQCYRAVCMAAWREWVTYGNAERLPNGCNTYQQLLACPYYKLPRRVGIE